MTIFQRPVSPTEWVYLATAPMAQPFAVQLVVEGSGELDQEQFIRAVAVASDAAPGSRLVRRGRQWLDGGKPPPVRVLANEDTALLTPLDTSTCEVLLIPGEPAKVVFRAFHGVMDGRGALLWATDVFRALRGERPLGAPDPTTDVDLLEQIGVGGQSRPASRWPSPVVVTEPGRKGFQWRRRTIDGNHAGLVAKVAAVIGAQRDSRVMVPADLRRHDENLRSTANLSLPLFLDVPAGSSWTELHEWLLVALTERRELGRASGLRAMARLPLPVLRAALRLGECAQRVSGRYPCTAVVSHLGRIELPAFAGKGFDPSTVYSLPLDVPFAPVTFVAVEVEGRTELTMSCRSGAIDSAEELLDRVQDAVSPRGTRLWSGNDTDRRHDTDRTIAELFVDQVLRSPDAVALTGPDGDITYTELDERADVVARELRKHGVGPGQVVGLLADRSAPAIVGLLGVLKAGGCYLPLDARHPDTRINYVLADAGAKLCLAQKQHSERVNGPKVLVLEDFPSFGASAGPLTARPTDLAYVIYTSGSTGRPKGVQVEHRNLVNYVTWARQRYAVTGSSRFALFTSLAFDLTGSSIFLPLLAGGSVVMVPGELDQQSLRYVLEESGANSLKLTPTHLDLVARLGLRPSGFRVLVVGGEQLTGQVASRAQRTFGPDCCIVNEYGPTEATIGCIAHIFDSTVDSAAGAVPIGLPADNTKVFLLNAERAFVPEGEAGEVYLAGAQLARSYLGRPALDRERFVRLADGTRAYRTGDLARVLPRGVLEYLGRTDDQIKMRGHRIEPAEIEAALIACHGVEQVAVRARTNGRRTALCAYFVGEPGLSPDALREQLTRTLPSYLVPEAIIAVRELPLTINGKIDTSALPDPFHDLAVQPGIPLVRDEVAETVAAIWSRVLDVDVARIGPDSTFHGLGGDSITLIQMVAAVSEELLAGGALRVRDLFPEPTLERVCQAVRNSRARTGD